MVTVKEGAQSSWTRYYSSSLISNIRQIMTGLQGFEAMASELIQSADDAGGERMRFDIDENALRIWNSGEFSNYKTHENTCPWKALGNPLSGTCRACDFDAISEVGSVNKYRDASLMATMRLIPRDFRAAYAY
jgi:hypothetical protein